MRSLIGKLILAACLLATACQAQIATGFSDVAFVASLNRPAASGGGGSPGWNDVNASGNVDTAGVIGNTDYHWTAITLPTGSATKARIWIQTASDTDGVKIGLYNAGGTLVASGTGTIPATTGYLEILFDTPAAVTSGTHYLGWIQGGSLAAIGYQNGVGSLSYRTGVTYFTTPSPLPSEEGSVARKYAVGVWVE